MKKAVIYQVLPRFWGNGRFSDWKSEEFTYVKSLGATHIWFTGIPRHATAEAFVKGNPGSPYAVCDYYDVNPYLADNEQKRVEEFKQLLKRTHRSGLKSIIDFVPNHIACNYSDSHGGIPHFDRCDYDWTDTLKIDYSNKDTWRAMLDILRFWAESGVDGFRCDMAELVPAEFFGWVSDELKKDFPDLLFLAEVYETGNYYKYLNVGKFDLLYDKSGIYDTLRAIMCCGTTAEALTWNWQRLGWMQPRMLNFLENHDEQRLASDEFLGRADRSYAALAVAALFNDASFMLYAGQEVGEDAHDSDNGRTSIFNWTKVEVMERRRGNLTLKNYRRILSCLEIPAFRDGGNWDLCYCNGPENGFDRSRHFAFLRFDSEECWLVFCNFSSSPASVNVVIPKEAKEKCHPEKDSISIETGAWDAAIRRI